MFNFGSKSFEERKDSLENGKCTCFPENEEHGQCLKNCKFRKEVVKRIEEEKGQTVENNSDGE